GALERIEGLLACPRAGDVVVSAAPGVEYRDAGGIHHEGGGSHGSLHAVDSLVPLITAGFEVHSSGLPEVPSITDLTPMAFRHFGVGSALAMDDAHAEPAPAGVRGHARRVHLAVRKPDNWFELGRFLVVGASGYVVNLAVFYLADRSMPYPIAFILAFVVAATSNFVWNRWWTFRVHHGVPHHQYMRFLTVSALALGIDLIVLTTLVEWVGMSPLAAAAVAIVIATPVSFLGNKIWSFK